MRYNILMIYGLIAGNALMLISFFFRLPTLPPQIPLLYSKPWGEEQLVDNWLIFLLPVLMNIFFFLNLFIYQKYFLADVFAKNIFKTVNWFVIISCTVIFIKIVFLVS